ncbi:MAG: G5 domain-containing protein, partial [Anaerolineales bacterium]|nr:G5 domain-containing protein [Anaerolineales bacterium]
DGQPAAPGQDMVLAPSYNLQVLRAQSVQIDDQGQTQTILTTAATLGEALWEAGIQLHTADQIDMPLDTPVTGPLAATITRARSVSVRRGSQVFEGYTTAETVGEALAEIGFSIQGLDYSVPAEWAPVPTDGEIDLVRVLETTLIDKELLPFESELGPDPEMPIDTRGISKPGAYGVDATRTRVRYEDGREVWRQVEDSWVALEPQAQVLGYGTKIEVNTISTPQGDLEYWRAVSMYATSYSPCRIFSDRCDSVTSSGATLRHGVAAVTLRHYRSMAGSQVYIPGYGIATILDVGGGIPGRNWIDLGYSDDDYISWHDWVTVYFLTPVPPEGLILYDLN